VPDESALQRFDSLNVWSRGGQRAPHKPLLVLYALGRWCAGQRGAVAFRDAEADLTELLKRFGPARHSYHPEYPFWRLQNDGVWRLTNADQLTARKGNTDPPKSELIANDVRGAFADDVQAALIADPALAQVIAARLLAAHFPDSFHEDILEAVGLDMTPEVTAAKRRDPHFRQKVLKAYGWRCAVCGFDVRMGQVSIALDAAHVRWHQAGGPAEESNGLALCVLHHKVFDLGAFTVTPAGVLLVSDEADGNAGFEETLMRHHGRPIRGAQKPEWAPLAEHLEWHRSEVFKGEPRHLQAG
jgi:putative restriction endonuclease